MQKNIETIYHLYNTKILFENKHSSESINIKINKRCLYD